MCKQKKYMFFLSILIFYFIGLSIETKPLILDVKKISPIKNAEISKDELMNYLVEFNVKSDRSGDKDSSQIKIEEWLSSQRLLRQTSWDDDGLFVYDFPRNQNGPDRDSIDYYYYIRRDGKSDSVIFISNQWHCPKFKQLLVYMNQYPFLKPENRFNYLGNNTVAASSCFSLNPLKWDTNEKKYTEYTPAVSLKDSSSILAFSSSGFNVCFETVSSSRSSEDEKKIIFEKLFTNISDISCLNKLTLQKLGTNGAVSRFIGQMQFCQGYLNSWFIADIESNKCSVKLFEINRGLYSSRFYCAYKIGANSLPDVFLWVSESETAPVKELFYKSKKRWVVTVTRKEYTGNCFNEKE